MLSVTICQESALSYCTLNSALRKLIKLSYCILNAEILLLLMQLLTGKINLLLLDFPPALFCKEHLCGSNICCFHNLCFTFKLWNGGALGFFHLQISIKDKADHLQDFTWYRPKWKSRYVAAASCSHPPADEFHLDILTCLLVCWFVFCRALKTGTSL